MAKNFRNGDKAKSSKKQPLSLDKPARPGRALKVVEPFIIFDETPPFFSHYRGDNQFTNRLHTTISKLKDGGYAEIPKQVISHYFPQREQKAIIASIHARAKAYCTKHAPGSEIRVRPSRDNPGNIALWRRANLND